MNNTDESEAPAAIDIPTLNLDVTHSGLSSTIAGLLREVEEISVFRSVSAWRTLRKLSLAKRSIARDYDAAVEDILSKAETAVSGPGIALAFAQSWSTARGLVAFQRLTGQWSALIAAADRKGAYATACFSMYLSIFSIILTVAFGVLSLPSGVATMRSSSVGWSAQGVAVTGIAPGR
jgi:hypothetical protein